MEIFSQEDTTIVAWEKGQLSFHAFPVAFVIYRFLQFKNRQKGQVSQQQHLHSGSFPQQQHPQQDNQPKMTKLKL